MELRLLRHATLVLTAGEQTLLVDPMLGPAGATPAAADTPNPRLNPLVDLPMAADELDGLLARIDAVLVTHTHRDHWDDQAQERIPKATPVFCQVEDAERIEQAGFEVVYPVDVVRNWKGLQITRTDGRHGQGKTADRLGPVSGFLLRSVGEPALYIAGDTVWCPEVEQVLHHRLPEVIVVNAGAARFLEGEPITMTASDVIQVCHARPAAQVIAVHMDCLNHCLLTREGLRRDLGGKAVSDRVWIPGDGERRSFSAPA